MPLNIFPCYILDYRHIYNYKIDVDYVVYYDNNVVHQNDITSDYAFHQHSMFYILKIFVIKIQLKSLFK